MQTIDAGAEGNEFVIDEQDLTEVADLTPEELEAADTDWKAQTQHWRGIAKRRTTALKTAKGRIEALGKPATPPTSATPAAPAAPAPTAKPGELDYGQKAYLRAEGIKVADEEKLVTDWMKDTGKDLETVLGNARFQAELADLRQKRTTQDAVPGATPRAANAAKDTVEYWLNKPFDQVPKNMRMKVINARKATEGTSTPGF
jgi:hypothetical protein